jgi:glyoxylase-like metal-dependent hydrolase (beta-lactamase superfamily II)
VTLVDAGWPGDEATVRAGLDAAGVAPADVDRVLLTHYDADHVHGWLDGVSHKGPPGVYKAYLNERRVHAWEGI